MSTIDQALFACTLFAALGCGLIAGVFFAFSSFVMKALARRPASEGMAAMQSINVVVLNRWFLGVFFGTAALCVVALTSSLVQWHAPGAGLRLIGALLYLMGTIFVTMAFNVPKNEALAAVSPTDPGAHSLWAEYVTGWTAWNHVRTVAALAAAASFTLALGG